MLSFMLTGEIYRLIAANGGVISRKQLRAIPVSDSTIRRQVSRGLWEAEGRSALVAAGTPRDLAVLTRIVAVNHPSLVPTGASALSLAPDSPWRPLLKDQDLPWMIGPRDSAVRWLSISHPGARLVERCGLWVASDQDALIDLVRLLPRKQAREVAMVGLQRRMVTLERMQNCADYLIGYAGAGQLRTITRQLSAGAQSEGERRLIRLLKQAGITGWVANLPVIVAGRRFVLDIAFPACGLFVEFDGWRDHGQPGAFQGDRTRQNALVGTGWQPLRFTWADLDDPGAVVAQVWAALRERGAA